MTCVASAFFCASGKARISSDDKAVPSIHSLTRISFPTRSQCRSGTRNRPVSSATSASSLCAAASRRRSSSSMTARRASATKSLGRRRRSFGTAPWASFATRAMVSMSRVMRVCIFGRRTLTATVSPECSTPLWTCATDAAATGSERDARCFDHGAPHSAAIISSAFFIGKGGTLSFRTDRPRANSTSNISPRVARICPNFI